MAFTLTLLMGRVTSHLQLPRTARFIPLTLALLPALPTSTLQTLWYEQEMIGSPYIRQSFDMPILAFVFLYYGPERIMMQAICVV